MPLRDHAKVSRSLLRLLGERWTGRWVLLVAIAVVGSVMEVLGALGIYLLMMLLTDPASVSAVPLVGALIGTPSLDELPALRATAALSVLAFFLIRGVVVIGRSWLEGRVIAEAGLRISNRLFSHYLSMPYSLQALRNTSERVRSILVVTDQLQRSVMLPLLWAAADGLLVFGVSVAVVWIDPLAAAAAAAMLGGVSIFIQGLLRPRLFASGRLQEDSARAAQRLVIEALSGARDIKILRQEATFSAELLRQQKRGARAFRATVVAQSMPRAVLEVGTVVTVMGIGAVALVMGRSLEDSLATVVLFAYAGIRLQPILQRLLFSLNLVRSNAAVVDDMLESGPVGAGLPQGASQHSMSRPESKARRTMKDSIRVVSASFSYDASPEDPERGLVLDGVDIEIRRGEFIGICGPTGSGKSTLVDLVSGLLQPTSGTVLIDGEPLEGEPVWWWSQLGTVPQQPFFIDDTLRRNITFGPVDGPTDARRLASSVERAQLQGLVASLPDGLDTRLGERGVRLSGGQLQRVALARAIYREPAVVILDEATSALDGVTESLVVDALRGLGGDTTVIAVSHRPSTLEAADRVLVLVGGRVVGVGKFEDLLRDSPLFRGLMGRGQESDIGTRAITS